ncbi:putative zinc finger protein [Aspergillus bombycis]|uniref:polynucleotide adenylyltransferase n=1 Tax=Aspergillus bombycis TaxID=109264 RepID=A0A1F7ZP73_9EURO|nr:putative zinc finger protein [Aspergillus bombycis]OGM41260.1 putative zinc finger protein [Aspergillus bombycis]
MAYEIAQHCESSAAPIMTDKRHDLAHGSAIATPIFSRMDHLPCHVIGMLSHASTQLLSQQQAVIASHYANHYDIEVSTSSSTHRQRGFYSKSHVEECTMNDKADTYPVHHQSVLEIAHASNPAGYSYSHAPRTRFGDQQSDPCRRFQLQINYLNSLAARVPSFGSLASEFRSKEALRTLLTNIAREALERHSKQHGYTIEDTAIDLKCFGSLRNGFALPGADLDLVMTTHSEVLPKGVEARCPQILYDAFLDAGFDVRIIQKARVSIVKLYKTPSQGLLNSLKMESRGQNNHHFLKQITNLEALSSLGVQCDINFSGRLVLYNTELLRRYALCDERVRVVGVFVKMWAKARKINSPYRGTLCSYGYILMVIHYLMNVVDPPLVPNLQLLGQLSPRHSSTTGPNKYDVRFLKNETELRRRAWYNMAYGNRQSAGELLRGFFAYYGSRCKTTPSGAFNWIQNVVSIRTHGGILSKLEKGWNTARTDEHGRRLRFLIAIEDPFEHNHNVGRTVTDKGLETIRAEFSRAQIIIRRVQEIPGVGWEWRTDNGHVGQDLLAEAEDNLNQQPCGTTTFAGLKNEQVSCTRGMDFSSEIRAYNRLICPAAAAQKQRTQRESFHRQATLAANTMRRMLRIADGQGPGASYGVTFDSMQFRGPNAIHKRDSAAQGQMNQCEIDTTNVELLDTLPFNEKSLC